VLRVALQAGHKDDASESFPGQQASNCYAGSVTKYAAFVRSLSNDQADQAFW